MKYTPQNVQVGDYVAWNYIGRGGDIQWSKVVGYHMAERANGVTILTRGQTGWIQFTSVKKVLRLSFTLDI